MRIQNMAAGEIWNKGEDGRKKQEEEEKEDWLTDREKKADG